MLKGALRGAPVSSIDEVLAVMTAIDAMLPDSDGLKWFNRLYLQVTRSVRQAVGGTGFRDARFMTELDVVFANLYFAAVAAGEVDPSRAPSAWRPLLRARTTPKIARLQFALAGMNAHINRDLPLGIVQVFDALGGDPTTDALRRQDFDSVNALLERVEDEVKSDFSIGVIAAVDELAGRADDAAAMFKVREARKAAWTNAEVLWTLRRAPHLREAFFDRLDGLTGLAGKGLLVPVSIDSV
ncbi:MAG TPA: DUF5995 family protein [Methylomirabilota bacterium]|jgi:hypothetical protein|nr:DUF5995 family protein [Methylomirabilota bacterium]